jgi:GH15 family glucan-1,4-alpha-glucosidase
VDAFLRLGLHDEVHAALTFLLRCVRSTTPGLKVFYTLDGAVPGTEATLNAPGYRDSRPVRSGNGAAAQTQLGTFGDLFAAVWRYVEAGHLLDPPTGRLLADLADRCCDLWRTPDAGIWELHDDRHYTASKIGCWVALDRALRLYEARQLAAEHPHRWAGERDAIRDWVHRHCWSRTKKSYTFYAGTDDLDAAVLLAAQNGFDHGPRMADTISAVRRELGDGPLVHRYTGMQKDEGAFLACSFWLATALAKTGRRDEAVAQMDASVALANDVGILAEEMDPAGRAMLGNLPQGLSHLALINAAHALLPA